MNAQLTPVPASLPSARPRRAFVNETFAKCTDANRQAVELELKQVIYQAFEKGQLHSTDWKNYKLKRCVLASLPLALRPESAC